MGKYLLIRIINALIVLSIVTLVVSALFVKMAEKDLENRIQELVNSEYQSLLQQNKAPSDPEKWREERIAYYKHQFKLDRPYW